MNGYNFSDASDIRLGSSTITALYYGSTLIWPKTPPVPPTPTDWSTEYLQVYVFQNMILRNDRPTSPDVHCALEVKYSLDKTHWYDWNSNTSLSLSTGDIVYFKGSYSSVFDPASAYGYQLIWSNSSQYFGGIVRGNIMSLIYGDNFIGQTSLAGYDSCFYWLFKDLQLEDASNIIMPATTLSDSCYSLMFKGCRSLINAPILPATTLANYCYGNMFGECISLTSCPALPAVTLATNCYQAMFYNCSSLINPPALPAVTLANYCYKGMFGGCTSLDIAPTLAATTLADYCYDGMFGGCTSLNYIKCLAPSISWYHSPSWTYNVASSGTFIKHPNATWQSGVDGIPLGWTVMDAEILDDFYAKVPEETNPIIYVGVEGNEGEQILLDYEYIGEISGESDIYLNAGDVTWTCDNFWVNLDILNGDWYIEIVDASKIGNAKLTLSINNDCIEYHAPVTYDLFFYQQS